MSIYRIFYVGTSKSKPVKAGEGAKWFREKGQAYFESYSGVKSVQTFATQFGLGQDQGYEFWFEIEDYAVLDQWDADMIKYPEKYGPGWVEYTELIDSGPSRLMGDWPESRLL